MGEGRLYRFLAVLAVLALLVTACSGDGGSDEDAGDEETTDAAGAAEEEPAEEEPAAGEDEGTEAADGGGGSSDEPIRIGMLTSFTGPFTPWGIQLQAGMQMAAEEINADGGVDGRMIELVEADDQNNPEEGVTA
ncbi:ABC transporter substrate-binding protein, partial [Euzebya sp.]|uniref:ABC transporter substrate-binding protein n=1 Tax=Euzebya sp. TaxID=1971409 RepID=UPI0035145DBD